MGLRIKQARPRNLNDAVRHALELDLYICKIVLIYIVQEGLEGVNGGIRGNITIISDLHRSFDSTGGPLMPRLVRKHEFILRTER